MAVVLAESHCARGVANAEGDGVLPRLGVYVGCGERRGRGRDERRHRPVAEVPRHLVSVEPVGVGERAAEVQRLPAHARSRRRAGHRPGDRRGVLGQDVLAASAALADHAHAVGAGQRAACRSVSRSGHPARRLQLATRLPLGIVQLDLRVQGRCANWPDPSAGVAVLNCSGLVVSETSTEYQSSVCAGTRSNCVTNPHGGEPGAERPDEPGRVACQTAPHGIGDGLLAVPAGVEGNGDEEAGRGSARR